MNIKYKVLVYNAFNNKTFVDVNMLTKGIYATPAPVLYHKDDTIENIISRAQKTMSEKEFKAFEDNILQCRLATTTLIFTYD